MTSKRQLRKQSKAILENMNSAKKEELSRVAAPKRTVITDQPNKKSFCERHPKTCKAGKVAGMVGLGAGAVAVDVATDGGAGLSEFIIEPVYEKTSGKIKEIKRTHELRENTQKKWEEMQNKSAKKPKSSSPKKSTGTVKKKSPTTAQKRSQAKKSTTAKKKSTTKKKTSRKSTDDLDYWRL